MLPANNRLPQWMNPPGAALGAVATAQASGPQASPQGFAAQPTNAPPVPDLYGDASTVPIIAAANLSDILSLQRPPPGMRRTLLIIQNRLVGTELFFAFGRQADNGQSTIGIAAGGNLILDEIASIPQNDLHLFFPIAGLAVISYINAPLSR